MGHNCKRPSRLLKNELPVAIVRAISMRVAITGGTGFVGRHLARLLAGSGHEVVLIARGIDRRDESIRQLAHSPFLAIGTRDAEGIECLSC